MTLSWKALLATGVGVAATTALPLDPLQASSGIYTQRWENSGFGLSETTYSNVAGFWQVIAGSNSCINYVDGIFGAASKSVTKEFQVAMGISASGVVDSTTWAHAYDFVASGIDSLIYLGTAYGFKWYTYYGGSASDASLARSTTDGQWWFQQGFNGSGSWIAATASRTMGSVYTGYPECPH